MVIKFDNESKVSSSISFDGMWVEYLRQQTRDVASMLKRANPSIPDHATTNFPQQDLSTMNGVFVHGVWWVWENESVSPTVPHIGIWDEPPFHPSYPQRTISLSTNFLSLGHLTSTLHKPVHRPPGNPLRHVANVEFVYDSHGPGKRKKKRKKK